MQGSCSNQLRGGVAKLSCGRRCKGEEHGEAKQWLGTEWLSKGYDQHSNAEKRSATAWLRVALRGHRRETRSVAKAWL